MIRPGTQVVRLGQRGKGQVVGIDGDTCAVLWRNGPKRESHPQTELAWIGLAIHTRDGRAGRVVELGRNTAVCVRLADGRRAWMQAEELAPREQSEQ
ncbi:MAG: hypothetical protein ABSE53_16860 [Terracidiphilus sp.]|jgi:hypothetical protein